MARLLRLVLDALAVEVAVVSESRRVEARKNPVVATSGMVGTAGDVVSSCGIALVKMRRYDIIAYSPRFSESTMQCQKDFIRES